MVLDLHPIGSSGDRRAQRDGRREPHVPRAALHGGRRIDAEAARAAYRFPAAVRAIDAADPVDWSEVTHRAGFYDQAHFGNELRAFTGTTPTQYLGVRRRFLREHPWHAFDVGPLPAA
jgi:AraC-like DNA-binding protein